MSKTFRKFGHAGEDRGDLFEMQAEAVAEQARDCRLACAGRPPQDHG
jgi:hypothetical protein